MLPNDDHVSRDENRSATIEQSFLRYDQDWQHGIRGFQEDVQEGRYDPAWLSQAIEASKTRNEGGFDDFKETQYEEYWGQKQLVPQTSLASLNGSVKIENLIQTDILRVGDVLIFSVNVGAANGPWEKEITVGPTRHEPGRVDC